jgi:nucleotide-binding universal stress UspA family protein
VTAPLLVCVDGSELSLDCVRRGLAVVDADGPVVLAIVIDAPDHSLVMGTGIAGGVMSPEEFDQRQSAMEAAAQQDLEAAAVRLGLPDAERRVLQGVAGAMLCDEAERLGARALVVGTRGHGGVRRAVLGSVADHLVRNAPCPVVVTTAKDD